MCGHFIAFGNEKHDLAGLVLDRGDGDVKITELSLGVAQNGFKRADWPPPAVSMSRAEFRLHLRRMIPATGFPRRVCR